LAQGCRGILIASSTLFLLCAFRIFVRVFKWMAANFFRPWQHAAWDPASLMLELQLGETLRWEIAGLLVGVLLATAAIRLLSPL
jgi:hypothetical protein